MPNKHNIQEVEALSQMLAESDVFYLADYRGLTVEQFQNLRGKMREAGIKVRVAKNRLIKNAWKDTQDIHEYLVDPTALILAKGDPVTPAKIIKDFQKENELPKVKAIVVENEVYGGETFAKFAEMDSPEQLKGKLVNVLAAPLSGLVGVLSALPRNLVYALHAIAEKNKEN